MLFALIDGQFWGHFPTPWPERCVVVETESGLEVRQTAAEQNSGEASSEFPGKQERMKKCLLPLMHKSIWES